MNKENRKYYLLNLIFLIGLIVLFINDHYLKLEFSNWVTGKLSDFMGVLILPMLLTYIFPKSIKVNILFTGLFFMFWKSPFSQAFIEYYNQMALIKITRVVDYSDLIALICLPISYFYLINLHQFSRLKVRIQGFNPVVLMVPIALIFMATSPPANYGYKLSDGELRCYNCSTTVGFSKAELLEILNKNKYTIRLDNKLYTDRFNLDYNRSDSTSNKTVNDTYYIIDQLVINKDTITALQFALQEVANNKTKIWINGMNIPKEIPNNKVERKLRKYYRKLLKDHIKHSISNNG